MILHFPHLFLNEYKELWERILVNPKRWRTRLRFLGWRMIKVKSFPGSRVAF